MLPLTLRDIDRFELLSCLENWRYEDMIAKEELVSHPPSIDIIRVDHKVRSRQRQTLRGSLLDQTPFVA